MSPYLPSSRHLLTSQPPLHRHYKPNNRSRELTPQVIGIIAPAWIRTATKERILFTSIEQGNEFEERRGTMRTRET